MKIRKKIILVFGTRPEAIKMAPLYRALKSADDEFITLVCVTGQHRQMLDQVLEAFDIEPDIDLNIMKTGQDLFDITSAVLLGMRDVIKVHKPDIILVHGDTTTTLAASLAGFYSGVCIGHIEAGLRTYDMQAPFPEELNRQIATKIAQWHFSPTNLSQENLIKECIDPKKIIVCGNTVIDALRWILNRLKTDVIRLNLVNKKLNEVLNFNWINSRYILITGHRRENFGDGFLEICGALKRLAESYPLVHFIYPVHLNPNVQNPVNQILSSYANVHLIPPLEYEPFLVLLNNCYCVLTDSGGIQEEAPSLGKPVLVMRDVTERPEAVLAGTVRLVGAKSERIFYEVSRLLENEADYSSMAQASNPYGDGFACERIIKFLKDHINEK